jgi:hypothetical protein
VGGGWPPVSRWTSERRLAICLPHCARRGGSGSLRFARSQPLPWQVAAAVTVTARSRRVLSISRNRSKRADVVLKDAGGNVVSQKRYLLQDPPGSEWRLSRKRVAAQAIGGNRRIAGLTHRSVAARCTCGDENIELCSAHFAEANRGSSLPNFAPSRDLRGSFVKASQTALTTRRICARKLSREHDRSLSGITRICNTIFAPRHAKSN